MSEAEKLKKRMSHIFLKRGGEGEYTKLIENSPIYHRELLFNDISLNEGELPVVLGFKIPAEWTLFTTKRIVWRYKGQINSVEYKQIKEVETFIEIQKRAVFPPKLDGIGFSTATNEKMVLYLEKGSSLIGIWYVMLHLKSRNNNLKEKND